MVPNYTTVEWLEKSSSKWDQSGPRRKQQPLAIEKEKKKPRTQPKVRKPTETQNYT